MYKLLPTLVCRKVEIDPCVASRESKLPRWAGLARPPRKAERVSVFTDGSQASATPPWGGSLALTNRCPLFGRITTAPLHALPFAYEPELRAGRLLVGVPSIVISAGSHLV